MSERSTRAGPVWDRLRRNRDHNATLFTDAGIRPERAASIVCPSCGAEESALFWSTTRRRRTSLYLLCPICEQARVRYNLARNRVVDPVFNRGSVGGGMGVVSLLIGIGALFHFRDTPPVRALIDDAYVARDAAVATFSRATAGRFGPSSAPPAPRGGTSGRIDGGGGSAARSAAPPNRAPSPTRQPARASAQRYALPGDRRAELQALGAGGAFRDVRFDSVADLTYLVIDAESRAGKRALQALPGARVVGAERP